MKLAFLVALTVLLTVAGSSPSSFSELWNTPMYDTTMPTNRTGHWDYVPGFAASVGDLYMTTDVNGTLYVIGMVDGVIRWTYNDWPTLPYKMERDRQIAGTLTAEGSTTASTVTVLRSETLYSFNATNGNVLFTQRFPGISSKSPSLMAAANTIQLSWMGFLQALDPQTGELMWGTSSVYSSDLSVVFAGDRSIVALVEVNVKQYALRVYDGATGSIQLQHQVSQEDAPNVYLFHVASDFFLYFCGSRIVRIDLTGAVHFNVTTGGLGPCAGYGVSRQYFYCHFQSNLASFDILSGDRVAVHYGPEHIFQTSILGYPNWVNIVVVNTTSGRGNLTGYAASNMSLLWSMPLTPEEAYLYGNWPGSLVVASTTGTITLLAGESGRTIGSINGGYTPLNPQSIVFGDTHLFLTYGAQAAGFEFVP